MDRMSDWITTGERPLPFFVTPFAKSASGSSKSNDDEDDDDDDDEDDDDEDDDDPDAEKSDDELRAELKRTREALKKTNLQSKKRRQTLREKERELEEARKPKSRKKSDDDDDDSPDLDTIRHEAKSEGEKAGILRAKKAEAKAALLGAGVSSERVVKAVGLLDLDDLDLDDDGLDGIDDAVADLRHEWPELFARKRTRRESVAGEGDRDGNRRRTKPKSASEQAADKLLRRSA